MGIKAIVSFEMYCDWCGQKCAQPGSPYLTVDALMHMAIADGCAWGDVPTLAHEAHPERRLLGWVCQECRKVKA